MAIIAITEQQLSLAAAFEAFRNGDRRLAGLSIA
jgi:hypothetical protein